MKTFIEEHKKGLVISAISVLVMPCFMAFLMQTVFRSIGGGTDDGWLGFWGGYLGSILGVLGAALFAYFNTKYQLDLSKANDLDNAIKISDVNVLSGILNDSMNLLTKIYAVKIALQQFEDEKEKNEYAIEIVTNFQKDWFEFKYAFNSKIVTIIRQDLDNREKLIRWKKQAETYYNNLELAIQKSTDNGLCEAIKCADDCEDGMNFLVNLLYEKINEIANINN